MPQTRHRCKESYGYNNDDIGGGFLKYDIGKGNSTLDIRNGTVTEYADDRSALSDDGVKKLTARRATIKILSKLDKLKGDSKYKVKGRLKFAFDNEQVKKEIVDTHIDESTKYQRE